MKDMVDANQVSSFWEEIAGDRSCQELVDEAVNQFLDDFEYIAWHFCENPETNESKIEHCHHGDYSFSWRSGPDDDPISVGSTYTQFRVIGLVWLKKNRPNVIPLQKWRDGDRDRGEKLFLDALDPDIRDTIIALQWRATPKHSKLKHPI